MATCLYIFDLFVSFVLLCLYRKKSFHFLYMLRQYDLLSMRRAWSGLRYVIWHLIYILVSFDCSLFCYLSLSFSSFFQVKFSLVECILICDMLLTFSVGDDCVNRYVTSAPHADYFLNLVTFLRKQCIDLNRLISDALK